eukprot:148941_1
MGCCNAVSNVKEYGDSSKISSVGSPTDNTPTTSKDIPDTETTTKTDSEIKITITKSLSSLQLPGWNMTPIGSNKPHHISIQHSAIESRLDLTVDKDKLQFQINMQIHETDEKFERERIKQICDEIFDKQIQNQHNFCSLYQVFKKYATNWNKDKMNIDGLTKAMAVFGLIIDVDKELQKLIWSKFDTENDKEIDFSDFSATMSSIITSKDDDWLLLLFQIFDIDKDGYLTVHDIARVLLSENHFGVVATGQDVHTLPEITYTRKMCLKQSKKFIQMHDKNEDDKVSFDEFKAMMINKTEKDWMIQFMEQPSNSFNLEPLRVSNL